MNHQHNTQSRVGTTEPELLTSHQYAPNAAAYQPGPAPKTAVLPYNTLRGSVFGVQGVDNFFIIFSFGVVLYFYNVENYFCSYKLRVS